MTSKEKKEVKIKHKRKHKLVRKVSEPTQAETLFNQSNHVRNADLVIPELVSTSYEDIKVVNTTKRSPKNSNIAIKPFPEPSEIYIATVSIPETITPKSLTEMVTIPKPYIQLNDCDELVCGHINTNCCTYKDKTTTLSTNSYNFVIN